MNDLTDQNQQVFISDALKVRRRNRAAASGAGLADRDETGGETCTARDRRAAGRRCRPGQRDLLAGQKARARHRHGVPGDRLSTPPPPCHVVRSKERTPEHLRPCLRYRDALRRRAHLPIRGVS